MKIFLSIARILDKLVINLKTISDELPSKIENYE